MSTQTRNTLYQRITASVPLLVTVIVHVLLIAIAGYFVVSEQIIGKKKIMEAAAPTESVAQKQVEHRLQVARKGGGSASSSPVSASRIFSTASDSLQMPAMPDLPSVGASSLSGMGFGAGMGAVGTGTGYATGGIGSGSGLGRGFMSMSFLGTTSQQASKILFIVDIGPSLLDIRKGGFEAFKIIREEMMKLVSRLPPSAEFGVVVFEGGAWEFGGALSSFEPGLVPATVGNKERFFEWMRPINLDPDRIGLRSLPKRLSWKPKELTNAGIDEMLIVPQWATALQCGLEMNPDTIYLITGSAGTVRRKLTESELAKRKRENEIMLANMKRDGLDPDKVNAARNAFVQKARAELEQINARLKAKGKPPFIIQNIERVFQADFQAALKREGESIVLDTKGWANKDGRPIWWTGFNPHDTTDYADLLTHISKLQRALMKDRAALNIFLFVGPNEDPKAAIENLGRTSSRNGGKFQLLTTKRLQEISARDEQKK